VGTVLVVSDTHLSERSPEARANWDCVVRYVQDAEPSLVVHLGDVTLDGAHDPVELDEAREHLDRLSVGWRAVPGNHDIGDNPVALRTTESVSAARRQCWLNALGADWWSTDLDGWVLVGCNAELFGSGLDAEEEQWIWLEESFATSDPRPVALFLHKPLLATDDEELAAAPPYRFAPPAAARRLGGLLAGRRTPVVLSGHVHQYRDVEIDGRRYVWAPTTWAVLPYDKQPNYGVRRCGVVAIRLAADGEVEAALIEPPGMRQITLETDIANPYVH
jgi:3',5'-cyclic AMP phosphodiesterase CpdA